jgi:hypothetical protein
MVIPQMPLMEMDTQNLRFYETFRHVLRLRSKRISLTMTFVMTLRAPEAQPQKAVAVFVQRKVDVEPLRGQTTMEAPAGLKVAKVDLQAVQDVALLF